MLSLIVPILGGLDSRPHLREPNGPSLSIEINVPAFRLDVMKDGTRVRSYEIAVGLPRYKTPLGHFTMGEIIWNPWWYPPDSYWARKEKITPPGPSNPMGKVKLSLGSLVYLHATPIDESIGGAASHGCIRMHSSDAIDLAKLVQDVMGASVSGDSMSSILENWSPSLTVHLRTPVPVRIVYRLVELRGDTLLIHRDVYAIGNASLELQVVEVLNGAGVDTALVKRAELRRAVRQSRAGSVQVRLSQLLLSEGR